MLSKFETSLTKYLVQQQKSRNFIESLDKNMFEEDDSKFIFSVLKNYFHKYKFLPSKTNLLQFFDKVCKKQKVEAKTKKYYIKKLKKLYTPLPEKDITYLEENLFKIVKRNQLQKLIANIAPEINSASSDDIDNWFYEFRKINELQNQVKLFTESKAVYITENKTDVISQVKATPTFLTELNALTATGGFYSPQLITILAPPKGFKTGFLLNLAVNFMIDGLKVYYADCENGEILTKRRIHQTLLECNANEVISKKHSKTLANILNMIKKGGGEIVTDYFPPRVSTLLDVESKLIREYDRTGFKPHVILYDYLDKFGVVKQDSKDDWQNIGYNYDHAVSLNSKIGSFAFTQSQIKATALKKKVIDLGDAAGTKGKIDNCHAAFAICQDEEEKKLNIARLVSVVQRDGKRPGNYLYMNIDYAKNKIYELLEKDKSN